jgi:hypothetical protein
MARNDTDANAANPIHLRRCLLITLYDMFREYPYASIELSYLQDTCQGSAKEINWNLVYLEKRGLVELDKSLDCPPYISCSATLSANGIDLVEDEEKFDRLFPGKEPIGKPGSYGG